MSQLQNIPSRSKPDEYDDRIQDLGPKIREIFEEPPPDELAPEGYDLIITDSSQLELRLGAHFTKDPTLVEVYEESVTINGMTFFTGDPHAETSKRMNVPRKLAKNLNFGLMYGMSPPKFARYAKLYEPGTRRYDFKSAERYVAQFRHTYAGVFQYHEKLRDQWRQLVRTYPFISGRARHFPRGIRLSPGTIYNSRIQGTAADIIKAQLWAIAKFLLPHFPGVLPLIQVHDEILLQSPKRFSKQVAVIKKFLMEYPWFSLDVPILASTKICSRWSDKDNDDVPEVGLFYAKIKPEREGDPGLEIVYHPKDWADYRKYDKQKRVAKKSAVAMLTNQQQEWARGFLPPEMPDGPLFGAEIKRERLLTPEEYRARREASTAEED